MSGRKSRLLIYIEFLLLLPLVSLVRITPLTVCSVMASFLSRVVFMLDLKHRRRVISHLVFTGVCADGREARVMARENFRQLALLALEIIKARSILNESNMMDHLVITGSAKAQKLFLDNNGASNAIIITAHYGNWEIAGMMYTIYTGRRLLSVMRDFDNPLIGDFITSHRSTEMHRLCPKEHALKELIKALRAGDSVCLLADQHAGRDEGVETTFFGKSARTHWSPASLHLKTGVPIMVGIMKRVGTCRFEFVMSDPIEMKPGPDRKRDIRKLTQIYTAELESLIRKCGPEQWLWAHRRWLDLRGKTVRE
ncbi:MAG: lysophospholipid acyltransferase family protein [Victivallales bacterium]|nr:lysophospholipid acyltransferase family protein [Victivallales bacterium]